MILISIVRLIIIILALSSPFFLSYKIILLLVILYQLQLLVFGGCVLTKVQFKDRAESYSYWAYVLEKAGFHPNYKKLKIFLDYILPVAILLIAYLYQTS